MDNFSACIQFAYENPVTYIATVGGDEPRVRAFARRFMDKSGCHSPTGTVKNVCRQLR